MSNIRVLLADDHAVVRAGVRKTIEEIPELEVVCELGDGHEILGILEREQIDCLLIDVAMPDFEPITAIRKIRLLYPDLKILVVSAYDDDIYVQGLLAAGVNGYHMKDQPLNDLKLAIQRVLMGERWISGSLISKLVEPAQRNPINPELTDRQRSLLVLLQQGLDNQSIAKVTGLSVKTVENQLTKLYRQLNVQSRLEAVHFVLRYPNVLGKLGKDVAQDEQQIEPRVQKNISILVVDDNIRYRKQLQRMIGKLCQDATIYEAEDIESAIHIVTNVEIQLALIDVVLGDEDGIACVRRIKATSSKSRLVLISAYPDREFHRQGIQSGAVAFLDKKDLDFSTLRQVINDVAL